MLITHVTYSLARGELEPGVAKIITEGWATVLEHQSFLLKNPGRAASAIEPAIKMAYPANLASAAAVLLAARDTITHRFREGWFDALKSTAEEGSKSISSP